MKSVEECIEERILKKEIPDLEKAKKSLETAEHKIDVAEQELQAKLYESALISGYSAMFHSGRALLFKDGYQEKSHYAVYVFVKERYGNRIEAKYLNELNTLRVQRHEVMYGIEENERKEIDEAEAEEIIGIAKGFLKAVKKLVE